LTAPIATITIVSSKCSEANYTKEYEFSMPSDFTMLNVSDILKRNTDPWRDILVRSQDLARILESLSSK
jgi:hypothetical protein